MLETIKALFAKLIILAAKAETNNKDYPSLKTKGL